MKVQVRKESIVIPNLNPNLDRYLIMHISDLHFKNHMNKNKSLYNIISSHNADLILITGDFITSDEDIDPVIEFLKEIKCSDGIFAILGNHDYIYSTVLEHFVFSRIRGDKKNNVKKLIGKLRAIGIKLLINESSIVKTQNSTIFLEGTDDPVLGDPKISEIDENYTKSDLKILLSHSPDMLYLDALQKKNFDIMLSGHTHGGQIRVPIVGPLVTSTKFAPKIEAFGLYKKGNMYVNVCGGIGYSALPIRINCPPEIVLITLKNS